MIARFETTPNHRLGMTFQPCIAEPTDAVDHKPRALRQRIEHDLRVL